MKAAHFKMIAAHGPREEESWDGRRAIPALFKGCPQLAEMDK